MIHKAGISFLSTLFLFLLTVAAHGQQATHGAWMLGAEGHYGFVMAHRPSVQPLQHSHLGGMMITLSQQADGKRSWHQHFHFPETGIKYGFFGLGNKEQLGYGHTVYPYIDIPLGKSEKPFLHFQFGWGLGYITKPFNRNDNYQNVAIGSHLNAVIAFNFHSEFWLTKRDRIVPAIGLTHFSNGSAAMPNLGINLITAQLHYSRSFGESKEIIRQETENFEKRNRFTIFGAWAFKQVYPLAGGTWYAWTLSPAFLRQYSPKSAAGISVDLFYDPTINYRLAYEDMKTHGTISNFRGGVAGAYEIIFSDFSVILQMGVYAKNAWKKDGLFYNRLGMRYRFYDGLFACINLKTHIARADFIEWGIGYNFNKKAWD